MLYRESDPGSRYVSSAFVGVFFIALSVFTGILTYSYVTQPQVLGTTIAQAGIGGQDGEPEGGKQIVPGGEPTPGVIRVTPIPTSATQPTLMPTRVPTTVHPTSPQQPTPIPTTPQQPLPTVTLPTPTPQQEIITITDPDTEIIIENKDEKLIIRDDETIITELPVVLPDPKNSTQIGGSEPQVEVVPGQNPGNLGNQKVYPVHVPDSLALMPTPATAVPVGQGQRLEDVTLRGRIGGTVSRWARIVGMRGKQNAMIPATSARITYGGVSPEGENMSQLDEWLRKYQFQVWGLGSEYVAIHRNGITTLTPYAVKLGLSKLSFKVRTVDGERQILYYPDAIWAYLDDVHVLSASTHDEPLLLVQENGELVYRIRGHSNQFMFAVIPVSVCREIVVSAQSRDIRNQQSCSAFDDIIDYISLSL